MTTYTKSSNGFSWFVYGITTVYLSIFMSNYFDLMGKYVDTITNSCANGAPNVGGDCICVNMPFEGKTCQKSTCVNGGFPLFKTDNSHTMNIPGRDWACYCQDKWSGKNCETCNAQLTGDTCNGKCKNHFSGNHCQNFCDRDIVEKNRYQGNCKAVDEGGGKCTFCSGHGDCNNGQCACEPGWLDTIGSETIPCTLKCPTNNGVVCSGHGVCTISGCQCQRGHGGDACQYRCLHECSGIGACTVSDNNQTCVCPDRFRGDHCQHKCPGISPCSGHGTCEDDGRCKCVAPYAGDSCNCNNQTACAGHGVCGNDGKCECEDGWLPERCNVCDEGRFGDDCQTACDSAGTCSGHGVCNTNGVCVCNNGWGGSSCSSCAANVFPRQGSQMCTVIITDETCHNNGQPNEKFDFSRSTHQCKCNPTYDPRSNCRKCLPGFYGNNCEIICDASNCVFGTCLDDGTCLCDAGFVGKHCDSTCTPNGECSGHGRCEEEVWVDVLSSKCICEAGYYGADCGISAPTSDSVVCSNKGAATIVNVRHTGVTFKCETDTDCGDFSTSPPTFPDSSLTLLFQSAMKQAVFGLLGPTQPFGPLCNRNIVPASLRGTDCERVRDIDMSEWCHKQNEYISKNCSKLKSPCNNLVKSCKSHVNLNTSKEICMAFETSGQAIDSWNAKHMEYPFDGENFIDDAKIPDIVFPRMNHTNVTTDCALFRQWAKKTSRVYPTPRYSLQDGSVITFFNLRHSDQDFQEITPDQINGFEGFKVVDTYDTFDEAMVNIGDNVIVKGHGHEYAPVMSLVDMCNYHNKSCVEPLRWEEVVTLNEKHEVPVGAEYIRFTATVVDQNSLTTIEIFRNTSNSSNADAVFISFVKTMSFRHRTTKIDGQLLDAGESYTVELRLHNGTMTCTDVANKACPFDDLQIEFTNIGAIRVSTGLDTTTEIGTNITKLYTFESPECMHASWNLQMPPGYNSTENIWEICKEMSDTPLFRLENAKDICDLSDQFQTIDRSELSRNETLECVTVLNTLHENCNATTFERECESIEDGMEECDQTFDSNSPVPNCTSKDWAEVCTKIKDNTLEGTCAITACECDTDTFIGVAGSSCQLTCPVNTDTGTACGFRLPPERPFGTCSETSGECDCTNSDNPNCDERCDANNTPDCNSEVYGEEHIRSFDCWGFENDILTQNDRLSMVPFTICERYLNHHPATTVIRKPDNTGMCRWDNETITWGGVSGELISALPVTDEECNSLNNNTLIYIEEKDGEVGWAVPGGIIVATHGTYTAVLSVKHNEEQVMHTVDFEDERLHMKSGTSVIVNGEIMTVYDRTRVFGNLKQGRVPLIYGGTSINDVSEMKVEHVYILKTTIHVPIGSRAGKAFVHEISNGFMYFRGEPSNEIIVDTTCEFDRTGIVYKLNEKIDGRTYVLEGEIFKEVIAFSAKLDSNTITGDHIFVNVDAQEDIALYSGDPVDLDAHCTVSTWVPVKVALHDRIGGLRVVAVNDTGSVVDGSVNGTEWMQYKTKINITVESENGVNTILLDDVLTVNSDEQMYFVSDEKSVEFIPVNVDNGILTTSHNVTDGVKYFYIEKENIQTYTQVIYSCTSRELIGGDVYQGQKKGIVMQRTVYDTAHFVSEEPWTTAQSIQGEKVYRIKDRHNATLVNIDNIELEADAATVGGEDVYLHKGTQLIIRNTYHNSTCPIAIDIPDVTKHHNKLFTFYTTAPSAKMVNVADPVEQTVNVTVGGIVSSVLHGAITEITVQSTETFQNSNFTVGRATTLQVDISPSDLFHQGPLCVTHDGVFVKNISGTLARLPTTDRAFLNCSTENLPDLEHIDGTGKCSYNKTHTSNGKYIGNWVDAVVRTLEECEALLDHHPALALTNNIGPICSYTDTEVSWGEVLKDGIIAGMPSGVVKLKKSTCMGASCKCNSPNIAPFYTTKTSHDGTQYKKKSIKYFGKHKRINFMQGPQPYMINHAKYNDEPITEDNWEKLYDIWVVSRDGFKCSSPLYAQSGQPCGTNTLCVEHSERCDGATRMCVDSTNVDDMYIGVFTRDQCEIDNMLLIGLQGTSGFTGKLCRQECPEMTEYGAPCNGHGTCSRTGQCSCDTANTVVKYTSNRRETATNDNLQTFLTFLGSDSMTKTTNTRTGWRGDGCELKCPGYTSDSDMRTICTGHGLCNDEAGCTCQVGYTGDNCQLDCPNKKKIEHTSCSGHGTCQQSTFVNDIDNDVGTQVKNAIAKCNQRTALDVHKENGIWVSDLQFYEDVKSVAGMYIDANNNEFNASVLVTPEFMDGRYKYPVRVVGTGSLLDYSTYHANIFSGTECLSTMISNPDKIRPQLSITFYTDTTNNTKCNQTEEITQQCDVLNNNTMRCAVCNCPETGYTGTWGGRDCRTCAIGYGGEDCRDKCPGFDGDSIETICGGSGTCSWGSDNGDGYVFKTPSCFCADDPHDGLGLSQCELYVQGTYSPMVDLTHFEQEGGTDTCGCEFGYGGINCTTLPPCLLGGFHSASGSCVCADTKLDPSRSCCPNGMGTYGLDKHIPDFFTQSMEYTTYQDSDRNSKYYASFCEPLCPNEPRNTSNESKPDSPKSKLRDDWTETAKDLWDHIHSNQKYEVCTGNGTCVDGICTCENNRTNQYCSCYESDDGNTYSEQDAKEKIMYTYTCGVTGTCAEAGGCLCNPGYYQFFSESNDNGRECRECPSGYYQSEVGKIECKQCSGAEDNKYQDQTAQTSCKQCADTCVKGERQTVDCKSQTNRVCEDCADGKYQDKDGQTFCHTCTTTCGAGKREKTSCSAKVNRVCEDCDPGNTYQDEPGQTTCKVCSAECVAGTKQSRSLTESTPCTVTKDRECSICDVGQYQDENNKNGCKSCKQCSTGHIDLPLNPCQIEGSTTDNSCQECAKGKYNDESFSIALCKVCPNGYFAASTASSFCTRCPIGWQGSTGLFDNVMGRTFCSKCPTGKKEVDRVCVLCPKDRYQDSPGATFCLGCLNTHNNLGCRNCPLIAFDLDCIRL